MDRYVGSDAHGSRKRPGSDRERATWSPQDAVEVGYRLPSSSNR